MDKLLLPAPAKINLSLDILGILDDGYHQLEMIMQSISLHDMISLEKRVDDKGNSDIKLTCSDERLPQGEGNLAFQAAELFIEKTGVSAGVKINIEKNIPLAAGLAGGSTDAAAVLKGLNKLYETELTTKQLRSLGSKIGTDVPFCIEGGAVFATERGDKLRQLPDIEKAHLVLVKPPVEVSTPEIYAKYDQYQPELNIPTIRLVEMINEKNIDWSAGWANVLEPVTEKIVSDVKTIKKRLARFPTRHVLMSGSGPSVYAVVENKDKAKYIVDNWPRSEDFICYCHTLKKGYPTLAGGGSADEG